MRISVFTSDANPSIDSPIYHLSRRRAEEEVKQGLSTRISARAIQRCRPTDGDSDLIGRERAIPPAKHLNKLQRPPRIHYPVPAVADHRKRWRLSFLNGNETGE
jgi:hypothetical protein